VPAPPPAEDPGHGLAKGWLFRMEDDGTLHVTTRSGITRTTKPWAMRRPPPPDPPPPDDAPPF
jgi:hypothetical protein